MTPRRTAQLGGLTFLVMLPETLPVPVLRDLVVTRFGVSDGLATLFLVANMIGALLATPLVGLHVDRTGRRRRLCVALLAADALLMQALAHPLDYGTFLLLRVVEGAAHLSALTLLMSLVADAAGERRGRALGAVGCGLTFGVATGAAIGGVLGKRDPLMTLHAASIVLAVAAVAAAWLLPADTQASKRPGYREVVGVLRDRPGLRAPLLLAFFDRFTVGFFTTGFPLLLAGVHAVETPTIGMMLAAFLYPFALLSYPFGRAAERWNRLRMVAIGSLVYGLAVSMVGIAPASAMWVLMPVCGVTSAVMFIPTLLWLLDQAPGVGRSTAMAAFHTAGSLGFLVGPLVCGEFIDRGRFDVAFAVAGASEIVGAILVVLLALRRRG
ncbi:MAG: MFS transporter [Planctomycetota bacterium]|nr:MFS transporter [Planctomycetota bacterium]